MGIPVLLFASYADALGSRTLDVPITAPCTTAELVAALRALPGGDRLPPKPLIAINQRWAKGEAVIQAADEVAVIPPVAGG
ncbi:MAG: MoaD/ThiS family protein [Gemmatimonadaceae bacterium]|nr:MoaD/ThiS family protein [Gemmatimonadaceae bacterium]